MSVPMNNTIVIFLLILHFFLLHWVYFKLSHKYKNLCISLCVLCVFLCNIGCTVSHRKGSEVHEKKYKSLFRQSKIHSLYSHFYAEPLNLNKNSITDIILEKEEEGSISNFRSFCLQYHSPIPREITIKITIPNGVKIQIERNKGWFYEEDKSNLYYILSDSISYISFNTSDNFNRLIVSDLNSQYYSDIHISFQIVENKIAISPDIMDIQEKKEFIFSINEDLEHYSDFKILYVDTTMLVDFILPITKNKDVEIDIQIYNDDNKKINILNKDEQYDSKTFTTLLEKDTYYVRISASYYKLDFSDEYPFDKFIKSFSTEKFYLKTNTEIAPTQPNSIRLLSQWFNETGLDKYFRITFYRCDSSEYFMPPKIDSLLINAKFELEHDISHWQPITKRNISNFNPTYFIYLDPFANKVEMSELEDEYLNRFGYSLWYKIFDKIRLYENISFDKIFIYIPVYQSMSWVYCLDKNSNNRKLSRCCWEYLSGNASTLLFNYDKINNTVCSSLIMDKIDMSSQIEVFLKNKIFNNDCHIEFLEKDKYSFTAIIRNVKGYILKSHNYWEKLELSCYIRESEQGKLLQTETDGLYATGLGAYPKDSQFDKSFEPQYKQNLVEFSH